MYARGGGAGSVLCLSYGNFGLQDVLHAAISFEVVEWSEQLRSVISVWFAVVGDHFG